MTTFVLPEIKAIHNPKFIGTMIKREKKISDIVNKKTNYVNVLNNFYRKEIVNYGRIKNK